MLTFLNYSALFLVLSRKVDRSAEADRHEAELRRCPAELLPSVDVFIPTYNEGPEVVERSILAALQIDYPRFQVWVLDDGGRDWLAAFCAENGAGYVHRRERSDAKAGNLNHGLSVSQGESFAIFDADFAPRRDFLYRTVGFFSDPRIGIVQTPQHFFNRDPIQHNLGLSEVLPDEQRLFFDVIAPCRDAWDMPPSAAAHAASRGDRPSRKWGGFPRSPSPRISSPPWSCSGGDSSRATSTSA